MANDCFYLARIAGENKDNVDQFFHAMQFRDMKNGYFMYRVYMAESAGRHLNSGIWVRNVDGFCAWSVRDCMMTKAYGEFHGVNYGDPAFKVFRDQSGSICYANIGMTAQDLCKNLNCRFEIWSRDPLGGFQEHFLLNGSGKIEMAEKISWDGDDESSGFPNYGKWSKLLLCKW